MNTMNIKLVICNGIGFAVATISFCAGCIMILSGLLCFVSLFDKMPGIVSKCQPHYYVCLSEGNIACKLPYYNDITNETCIAFDTTCSLMNRRNVCASYDPNYTRIFPWMSNSITFMLSIVVGLIACVCLHSIDKYVEFTLQPNNYNKVPTTAEM